MQGRLFADEIKTMQRCPECQTEQSEEAPFCTNCGYRIRRAETLREGVQPLSDAMLAEYLQNGGQVSGQVSEKKRGAEKRRDGVSSQDVAVERATVLESTDGLDAVLQGHRATKVAREIARDREDGPSTVVEGLKVVSSERVEADRSGERPVTSVVQAQPITATKSVVKDERVRPSESAGVERARFGMFGALWVGGTLLGLLLVFFMVEQRANQRSQGVLPADVKASVDAAPEKILIEEGPFRSGLSEETRSFILQSCRRFYDDPDEQCEQDKLMPGEYPERTVELDSFWIDSKEVTNAQYQACVKAGACAEIPYRECSVWTPQGLQISLRVPKSLQEPAVSVSCVTRAEAMAYCAFAGGTLPSHNQWEKAARGVEGGLFPWGDMWASDLANWGELDILRTSAVGKLDGFEWIAAPGHYPAGKSPYGVLDMAGNVAEWIQSDDPLVGYARGGSWISNPFDLRATGRLRIRAADRRTDVGFRCAYE